MKIEIDAKKHSTKDILAMYIYFFGQIVSVQLNLSDKEKLEYKYFLGNLIINALIEMLRTEYLNRKDGKLKEIEKEEKTVINHILELMNMSKKEQKEFYGNIAVEHIKNLTE